MKETLFLQAKFDDLVERYDEADAISVENVNYEMRRCWLLFLKAGFDANQVAKMMSLGQIWQHYDALTAHGANIDMAKLLPRFSRDFINGHWDEFVARGVPIDTLVKQCYSNKNLIVGDDEIKMLLDSGVNVKTVFDIARGALEFNDGWPERWRETFSILHEYGLSGEVINGWVKSHLDTSAIIQDIVEDASEEWEDLGVDPSDYIDLWIEDSGYRYFEYSLKDLPERVTLKRFIDSHSMEQILNYSRGYGFLSFIDDYTGAGGNVDALAQKFLNELGYSNEYRADMLDLVVSGATVIDVEKFINCIDVSDMDEDTIEMYYSDLKNAGVDEKLLGKFYPSTT